MKQREQAVFAQQAEAVQRHENGRVLAPVHVPAGKGDDLSQPLRKHTPARIFRAEEKRKEILQVSERKYTDGYILENRQGLLGPELLFVRFSFFNDLLPQHRNNAAIVLGKNIRKDDLVGIILEQIVQRFAERSQFLSNAFRHSMVTKFFHQQFLGE